MCWSQSTWGPTPDSRTIHASATRVEPHTCTCGGDLQQPASTVQYEYSSSFRPGRACSSSAPEALAVRRLKDRRTGGSAAIRGGAHGREVLARAIYVPPVFREDDLPIIHRAMRDERDQPGGCDRGADGQRPAAGCDRRCADSEGMIACVAAGLGSESGMGLVGAGPSACGRPQGAPLQNTDYCRCQQA